jgi:hypothetical protein
MKDLEIYVKSSALGKTGLHWRKVTHTKQESEIPSLLMKKIIPKKTGGTATPNYLIYEQKPSIMLMRYDGKLLLEVTGIESPQRSQQLGRKVLNCVVWVADDDQEEKEKTIRMIAASALRNIIGEDLSLREVVAKAVEFEGLEGFKVSVNDLEDFVNELGKGENKINDERYVETNFKIETNLDCFIKKLADELQNNQLPQEWQCWDKETKKEGVLVVVTEHLEEGSILHKAGVWRGLASNVKEPVEVEEPVEDEKKTNLIPNPPYLETETLPQIPVKQEKIPLIVGMLVILIILLVAIAVYIIQENQQKEQPQKIPIPQTLINTNPPSLVKEIQQ